MPDFTVMVLCGRAPRHLYVANRLCDGANVVAIVQETGRDLSGRKLLNRLKPASLMRNGARWLRDRRRYVGQGEARFFFGDDEPRLTRPDLLVQVPHINHPDVVRLADQLQPDLVAVFGTSLIRGDLLHKGRCGIVNLHGGLSPHYRGADCTFWALYNGEPEQVGCTLHKIDPGIDTGQLIAHVCPEVKEGDDELTLFWRGVHDSADVYVEMLERLARGETLGLPQQEKGKLYQVKQRGWREERRLAQQIENGLLRGVDLPRRVRWFAPERTSKSAGKPAVMH